MRWTGYNGTTTVRVTRRLFSSGVAVAHLPLYPSVGRVFPVGGDPILTLALLFNEIVCYPPGCARLSNSATTTYGCNVTSGRGLSGLSE